MRGNPRGQKRARQRELAGGIQPDTLFQAFQTFRTGQLVNKQCLVAAAGAGVGFGTIALGPLPKGRLLVLARIVDLVVSTADVDVGTTWNGNWALGTAPDADGSLAGAEVDIHASTAFGAATAKVSPATAIANTTAIVVDNRAGTGEVNFNMFVLAADIVDAQSAIMLLNGEVVLAYALLDLA